MMGQLVKELIAKNAVDIIIRDLSDRSGLGDEWDQTDDDIQEEIRRKWRRLIIEELTRANA